MKNFVLFLLVFLITCAATAQEKVNIDLEQKADFFIEKVRNAQESSYEEVVSFYNNLLDTDPNVYLHIEKCSFIDRVFFDEEEYYNPKYEEFNECLEELNSSYPLSTEALIFYHYNQYEDDSYKLLEKIVDSLNTTGSSRPYNFWMAFENLAYHYSEKEDSFKTAYFAEKAMKANKELDLSVLVAQQYIDIGNYDKAKEFLVNHIDSTKLEYSLYQKGELFEELEEYEFAFKAYFWLHNDGWDNSSELGRVLTKMGRSSDARKYLKEATENEWGRRKALEEMFLFDLTYSTKDTVKMSYNQMRDEGFRADPFGIYKIKMILIHGLFDIRLRDLFVFFAFIILIACCFGLPYLWVVPIYGFGKYNEGRGIVYNPFDTRWNLTHFWYISGLFLIISFLSEIVLDYQGVIAFLNDEFVEEGYERLVLANSIIFADILIIIGTLILLFRKGDLKYLLGDGENVLKSIAMGVSSVLILRFIYGLNVVLLGAEGVSTGLIGNTVLKESLFGLMDHYGTFITFLTLVVIAPIFEEIQFRGIMLGSASKYLPFWMANTLQALLFSLVHFNFEFILFYFVFGILTGFLRKSTGSFIAPIVLHATNNLIAFFGLLLIH